MRVPYDWLKDFVADLPAVDEVATRLTLGGVEVEGITRPDPRLVEGLVTARIVETGKHPNADRLTLCKVDAGDGVIPIVCGARNMKVGDAVVLAKPGTALPDGRKIARSKIRGEESRGMLCSAEEIGVVSKDDGILILDAGVLPGLAAAELLGIDAVVLELAVTPNRGDCLSVRGVAREIAALCKLRLLPAFSTQPTSREGSSDVSVVIEAAELCPLYTGIAISGVTVAASPPWLVARLSAAGMRPINNVVDVTNYVLWEYGQPLHAFDRARLAGTEIRVGRARAGESIETLDGERRVLEPGDLLIRDARSPVALAGVMGGASSAVQSATTEIFLESAIFAPTSVRKTSRRLGLISDSSYRFERGVDPARVEVALLRAAELLVQVAGGAIHGGVARAGAEPSRRASIVLRRSRISRILGGDVPAKESAEILERLGARVTPSAGDDLSAAPPSHRPDLEREIDLIEEVARVRGYDRIASEAPVLTRREPATRGNVDALQAVRASLTSLGASEVVPLAFTAPRANERFSGLHPEGARAVGVENPQGLDTSELRKSLLPALLEARAANVRNGVATTDLFSIGRTFSTDGGGYTEIDAVGALFAGPRRVRNASAESSLTFWHVKGFVEAVAAARGSREPLHWAATGERRDLHPRAAAEIRVGSSIVGYAGEVHPDELLTHELRPPVYVFELDLARLESRAGARTRYRQVPRFPASSRDVSLIVPLELPAARIVDTVVGVADPLVEHVEAFDEYRGEGVEPGSRALAFRLRYRALDRTLTDEEVAATHEKVVAAVLSALPVRLRA